MVFVLQESHIHLRRVSTSLFGSFEACLDCILKLGPVNLVCNEASLETNVVASIELLNRSDDQVGNGVIGYVPVDRVQSIDVIKQGSDVGCPR